ncbi:hypothetical protein OUZ56_007423 [Daphnia magna]|uniref:Uncharacterized protein n=1 Tax=Daphnia magna TaxID=35525 RepID=A0ABR0A9X6_9CRUS|nr:hypothetical protein OUZ56_007423 [Daphnia magna]
MTTTLVRVQVPGLNLQQEIGSSIRYTSATCLTHSVATPSQYYLIKQRDLNPNRSCRHVLPDSVQAPERDGVAGILCCLYLAARHVRLTK